MNHFKFGEGYVCCNIFPSAGKIERLSHTRPQSYANLHFCHAIYLLSRSLSLHPGKFSILMMNPDIS